MSDADERNRRWTLALGVEDGERSAVRRRPPHVGRADRAVRRRRGRQKKGRGGLGGSAPRVAKWLGDIREFFPAPVVQVVQKDAFERKGLRQMLLEPEFLATVEADVNLVADLVSLARRDARKDPRDGARGDRQGRGGTDGAARTPHRGCDPRRARPVETDQPAALRRYRLAAHHPCQSAPLSGRAPHRRARAAGRLPPPSAPHRRPGRSGAVRGPVRLDGELGRLCLDLRGGDGARCRWSRPNWSASTPRWST